MSIGLERFNTGWDNNDNYIVALIDSLVDSAGFSWQPLIIFNPVGNSASNVGSLPAGTSTSKLAVTVTVPLGVSTSPVVVAIFYRDQSGTIRGTNATFPQGATSNTCKIPILTSTTFASITSISSLPNPTGTLLVETPLYIAESFIQSEWPSATPGL